MRAEKDQVYKAKGLKLDRDVAIKVLREDYVSDPERLRRFEQEARTASALNLPNTIYIYDIDKHGRAAYVLCYFRANGTAISSIERDVQLAEHLLRVLVLRADHISPEELERIKDSSDGRTPPPAEPPPAQKEPDSQTKTDGPGATAAVATIEPTAQDAPAEDASTEDTPAEPTP